ncbi:cobalamin biosynthesis protein [Sulfitobacter aestuarii]|uniref:Cobalamin biosynthesis protein n=1 Tax=Sulfitobacter aestuarii TaxID=2161676 RepID=A0ABW5U9K5_9RHOB
MERRVVRVAGIGFRGAADLASLRDALTLAQGDGAPLQALVTEAAKARSEVFRALAQELGVPGLGIAADELTQMITPTQSARIKDRFGTGSLCEAAALAAAGPGARLVAARVVSGDGMATAAIAENEGTDT